MMPKQEDFKVGDLVIIKYSPEICRTDEGDLILLWYSSADVVADSPDLGLVVEANEAEMFIIVALGEFVVKVYQVESRVELL